MDPVDIAASAFGETTAGLARKLGVSKGAAHQWKRPNAIPESHCVVIERDTNAKATCEQLRDDIAWVRVPDSQWPHPQGRPCIDVAATLAKKQRKVEAANDGQSEAAA